MIEAGPRSACMLLVDDSADAETLLCASSAEGRNNGITRSVRSSPESASKQNQSSLIQVENRSGRYRKKTTYFTIQTSFKREGKSVFRREKSKNLGMSSSGMSLSRNIGVLTFKSALYSSLFDIACISWCSSSSLLTLLQQMKLLL